MEYTTERVSDLINRPAHAGHVDFLNTVTRLCDKLDEVLGEGGFTEAHGMAALATLMLAHFDDWPRIELRTELKMVIVGLTAATPKPQ